MLGEGTVREEAIVPLQNSDLNKHMTLLDFYKG